MRKLLMASFLHREAGPGFAGAAWAGLAWAGLAWAGLAWAGAACLAGVSCASVGPLMGGVWECLWICSTTSHFLSEQELSGPPLPGPSSLWPAACAPVPVPVPVREWCHTSNRHLTAWTAWDSAGRPWTCCTRPSAIPVRSITSQPAPCPVSQTPSDVWGVRTGTNSLQ